MEYVHMKDMRASCMEPTNVISQYKYQDGLGYYETTKDVSTNFFFGYLNKGTYVFEYLMFVTHAVISVMALPPFNECMYAPSIQQLKPMIVALPPFNECMYAPEFTAHSEGARVQVVP
jgi:hypothetical protein